MRLALVFRGVRVLVCDHIRKTHPQRADIPFVFLTALTDPRNKEAVEHLYPAACIEKPVNFNMFAEKIKVLVRRFYYCSMNFHLQMGFSRSYLMFCADRPLP